MSNRAVLVRLLMNQATRAEQKRRPARALAVMQRITTVAPGHTLGWWERARLEQTQGDIPAARLSLSSMLETTRDADVRAHVKSALAGLAG
jgi:regulator of sirC expression with transglutaminase-like and TPR domain